MNEELYERLVDAFQAVEPAQIGYRTGRKLAEVAIAAMAEPTAAMATRGALVHNSYPRPVDQCITVADAEAIYRAMLSQAGNT